MKSTATRMLFWLAVPFFAPASFCVASTMYAVSLNTTPLIGHPAGPFFLNFQFTDGQGTGDTNNTVTVSNFAFGGGFAIPCGFFPSSCVGGVSGDFSPGIVLTDSSFFNAFTPQFFPGTVLSFLLSFTTNVDAGPQPDEFSFAILDSFGFQIPTLDTIGDALIVIDLDSASPTIQTFATDPSRSPSAGGGPIVMGAPSVGPVVPEPSTLTLLFCGLAALWLARRRWI